MCQLILWISSEIQSFGLETTCYSHFYLTFITAGLFDGTKVLNKILQCGDLIKSHTNNKVSLKKTNVAIFKANL